MMRHCRGAASRTKTDQTLPYLVQHPTLLRLKIQMTTRRQFITTTTAATLLSPEIVRAAETDKPLFSIGLIADAQYTDAKPGGIRYYRKSIEKLGNAVKTINEAEVDFSIHLGDLIDREFSSFDEISEPLAGMKQTVYQIMGNHDFSVADDQKSEVAGKMGIKNPYYSFSRSGFRFVFLNGTEVSTFANPEGTPLHDEAKSILEEFKAKKRKNAQDWNAAIGRDQVVWLKAQIARAARAGENVIISCHWPILPDNVHNLWNDQEILTLIDENSETVVAWFNGHNHAGNYAERNGVHYLTVHGMVDTPDTNAFAVIDILPNALRIKGSGREPDRVMMF